MTEGRPEIGAAVRLRAGHDPEAWLADVLTRLPQMTNQDDLSALLPCNWRPTTATAAACASVA